MNYCDGNHHENIRTSLVRSAARYRALQFNGMTPGEYRRLREWFIDWHVGLQEAYAAALNEDYTVLGKQWHYDYVIKHNAIPPLTEEEINYGRQEQALRTFRRDTR